MALIGPRAVPVEFGIGDGVGFALLPGLTGLAQVTGRRGLPLADREMLNECYRANASLSLDLRILCKTLVVLARAVE
jgi:lipopolysaccharide/colanic/teichoic acid biosynthesis glycosyltransferase